MSLPSRKGIALARILACALSWMPFAVAAAQDAMPGSDIVSSRQADIEKAGQLFFHVNFDDSSWTHEQVAVCPAFTHYAFARYKRTPAPGQISNFLVIIALDTPPAQSLGKPWRSGILLLPDKGIRDRYTLPLIRQSETVRLFNRIWSDEMIRAGQLGAYPKLTWTGLSECYARFAGQTPLYAIRDAPPEVTIDTRSTVVNDTFITLRNPGSMDTTLVVHFDHQALITYANYSTSPH